MMTSFIVPYGFTGIAVALLGNLNPLGVLFSGILFGGLSAGALRMEVMTRNVSSSVAVVIQALIILFIAGRQMFAIKKRYRSRSSSGTSAGKTVTDEAKDDDAPLAPATAEEGV